MTARARALAILLLVSACAGPATSGSAGPEASIPPSAPASAPASPRDEPSQTGQPTAAPEALRWEAIAVADGPAAREDHTWTVAGDGRIALLFGGRDGATVFDDLWAYDLDADAWQQIEADPGPPARFGHEAVWAEGVGLVIFAGQAGTTFYNDLWAFDPDDGGWTQLPAAGEVPVPRYGSCAALGADGRLWISHGFTQDQVRFSDTRAYSFADGTWAEETPTSGDRPIERCLHGCWWTDAGELALYAGQTTGTPALADRWTYSDGTWTQQEGTLPPARNLYARARVEAATLVFGGQALDGSYLGDLWLLADGVPDAEELSPEGDAPPGRAGAELVRDEAGERLLLFGGRGADGALADLWVLRGVPAPRR